MGINYYFNVPYLIIGMICSKHKFPVQWVKKMHVQIPYVDLMVKDVHYSRCDLALVVSVALLLGFCVHQQKNPCTREGVERLIRVVG